jgi:hypothetical protein
MKLDRRMLVAGDEAGGPSSKSVTPMDVMSFVAERLRSLPPSSGRRYWDPLLEPSSRTYLDNLLDATAAAESILSSEDKTKYD